MLERHVPTKGRHGIGRFHLSRLYATNPFDIVSWTGPRRRMKEARSSPCRHRIISWHACHGKVEPLGRFTSMASRLPIRIPQPRAAVSTHSPLQTHSYHHTVAQTHANGSELTMLLTQGRQGHAKQDSMAGAKEPRRRAAIGAVAMAAEVQPAF